MDDAVRKARRTSTEEFKRNAVNLVSVEGYLFRAAADAVGVSSRSLREWHEKFAPKPEACGRSVIRKLSAEFTAMPSRLAAIC